MCAPKYKCDNDDQTQQSYTDQYIKWEFFFLFSWVMTTHTQTNKHDDQIEAETEGKTKIFQCLMCGSHHYTDSLEFFFLVLESKSFFSRKTTFTHIHT